MPQTGGATRGRSCPCHERVCLPLCTGVDGRDLCYVAAGVCDVGDMSASRVTIVATSVAVAGLSAWFIFLGPSEASLVATVVAAVAGVAAVGVAIWTALRTPKQKGTTPKPRTKIRLSQTGDATADSGGRANTGVHVRNTPKSVRIRKTGSAKSQGGGDANSGFEI
jgi:hypothetical protein